MRRWLALLLVAAGCAHAPGESASLDGTRPTGPAASLLRRKCQGCHAAPNPAAHTASAWRAGIAKMRGRLELTDAQWASLLALVPGDSIADGDK